MQPFLNNLPLRGSNTHVATFPMHLPLRGSTPNRELKARTLSPAPSGTLSAPVNLQSQDPVFLHFPGHILLPLHFEARTLSPALSGTLSAPVDLQSQDPVFLHSPGRIISCETPSQDTVFLHPPGRILLPSISKPGPCFPAPHLPVISVETSTSLPTLIIKALFPPITAS